MTQNQILMTIIIISSCFFIGSLVLQQGKIVLEGILVPVGINFLNFAVAAFLGIPGIFALYGIGFWQIFH